VFVRPFPGPGGKWRISTDSGKFPAWSRTTHEILFLGEDDHIMAVKYTSQGDTFSPGIPHVWSSTPVRRMSVQESFDVSPDGKRIVMFPHTIAEQSQGSLHVTFLLNFFDEIRRRVPAGSDISSDRDGKSPIPALFQRVCPDCVRMVGNSSLIRLTSV
jgi:hypothetical protein